ncbi:MAG: M48 family metallopeptidase [Deltaproteobacteria bacterium]|nr:M48 family metallopeptidase [Deltaproteobacteria bacterium]
MQTKTSWQAFYYDGRTAGKKPCIVSLSASSLFIKLKSKTTYEWPLANIEQTQGFFKGEPVRLEYKGASVLVEGEEFLKALMAVSPDNRFHGSKIRKKRTAIIAVLSLISFAALIALHFWGIPAAASRIAAHIPVKWEERLGASVVKNLTERERLCENEDLKKYMDEMVRRLNESIPENPYTFKIYVAKNKMVNALAAPGGHIIVFTGLIEATNSPEELAAVLAHEFQHVLKKHATKYIIQSLSTSFLFAAILGDASVAANAAMILSITNYSRTLEEEADSEAVELLIKSDIDPAALKTFFSTLEKKDPKMPEALRYISTHPMTGDRIKNIEKKIAGQTFNTTPIFPDSEWKDIKPAFCAKTETAEKKPEETAPETPKQ